MTTDKCRWCGVTHGPVCPLVKAIEFHLDGVTVKRVEFKTEADSGLPAAASYPTSIYSYREPAVRVEVLTPGNVWSGKSLAPNACGGETSFGWGALQALRNVSK